MTKWKFKPFAQDDTKENPIQSQFFTTEGVGNIANGIIREGIQNALDECFDQSKPVVIHISLFDKASGLAPQQYASYLEGLVPHLFAKDSGLRDLPDLKNDKMSLLLFEDFNTNGLRGEPLESQDHEIEDPSKPHNFYYFWRNVGITGKSEDKLGRWGVGKTVFPASSRINSFWGFTIQSDTGQALLLGQSILRKHNLTSNPCPWGYKPYGYYGEYSNESFFVEPSIDTQLLEKFRETFNLKRRSEPGLSLVVPFYHEDITLDSLLMAVLEQYFFPIIKGNLEVTVSHRGVRHDINSQSFDKLVIDLATRLISAEDEAMRFDDNALFKLHSFTQWALSLADKDYICLNAPRPENQPMWSEKLWENLDVDGFIRSFEESNRIAFRVPVKVHNKTKPNAKICWFKLYLERDPDLKKSENHFIRENITIIDVKSLESQGLRGIVYIDDKELANLLGDSENPAHTQWQKDSQNFKNKYKDGDKCIQFISRSLQRIYSKLQKPAVGIDKEILKDFFYVETPADSEYGPLPDDDSRKDIENDKPKVPPLIPNPNRIKVRRIDAGVIVEGKDVPQTERSAKISIALAYITSRGKPLSKYSPYDFEVDKLPIETSSQGLEILGITRNQVEFMAIEKDFELKLTGFDKNRDLFVKIDVENITHDQEI